MDWAKLKTVLLTGFLALTAGCQLALSSGLGNEKQQLLATTSSRFNSQMLPTRTIPW